MEVFFIALVNLNWFGDKGGKIWLVIKTYGYSTNKNC